MLPWKRHVPKTLRSLIAVGTLSAFVALAAAKPYTIVFGQEPAPAKEPSKDPDPAPVKESDEKVPVKESEEKAPVRGKEKVPVSDEEKTPAKGDEKTPMKREEKGTDAAAKAKDSTLEGELVKISGNMLMMTSKGGKEHSLKLTDDAQTRLEGKAFRAADLKPGMIIRVTTLPPDHNRANSIEVLDLNGGRAASMRPSKEGTPLSKPQPNEEKSPRKVMRKEGAEVEKVVTKGLREDFCECLNPNAANNWIFGNRARINFGGAPNFITVTPSLASPPFLTMEGCSTISDANGDLLFYTDGTTVWDKNGLPMPSGLGLMGNSTSTQSALIVHCSCEKYFIFTTDGFEHGYANGLRYSVVDMGITQNSGLGDVLAKNTLLLANSSEKVAGVGDGSGGFWVVAHSMNDNNFYAYHILPDGTCTPQPPVISAVGSNYTGGWSGFGQGQMKFSPDGKLLAHAGLNTLDLPTYASTPPSFVELFKFDTVSGVVSNYSGGTTTSRDTKPARFYGLEFSPDSQSLWATTTQNTSAIYHYPISGTGLGLPTPINPPGSNVAALQLGPDGKIYIARIGQPSLYVLPAPSAVNGGWVSPTDLTNSLPLAAGALSQYGLPAVVAGNFTCDETGVNPGTLQYDEEHSTICGPGQICFKYKLPTMVSPAGNQTGTGIMTLKIYQGGALLTTLTTSSPTLTTTPGLYCFPITPAMLNAMNPSLLGFDYVASATYSFGPPVTIGAISSGGQIPNPINDYLIDPKTCDPKPVQGCCLGKNLVQNGDFESNGQEINSEYHPADGLDHLKPGTYSVSPVLSLQKACEKWEFPKEACQGTKDLYGNVLFVNGLTNQIAPAHPSAVIWEQKIPVSERKTKYRVCFRYLPLPQCCFNVVAKPYLTIDGDGSIVSGSETDEDTGCGHLYSATIEAAGSSVLLQINLPQQDAMGDGNDLLIDNISVAEMGKVDPSYLAFALEDQAPTGGTYNCVVTAPAILVAPYIWTWELYDANDVLVSGQSFSGGATHTFANLPIETVFWVKLKVSSDCNEWTAKKRPSGILSTTRKAKAGLTDEPNAEPAKTEKGPLTPKRSDE